MREEHHASAVDDLRHAPTHSLSAVLRIPDFRRLWIGLGLSSLGDWIGLLALTAMANASADSYAGKNYAIATVLFLRVLPALVMGPIAGYIADKLDRRVTLIWGDYLRGALFLTIPIVGQLWWVFVVTVLVEMVSLVWGRPRTPRCPTWCRGTARGGQPDQPRHDLRVRAARGGAVHRADAGGQALPQPFEWFDRGPIDLALYVNGVTFIISGVVIATLQHPARPGRRGHRGHGVDRWSTAGSTSPPPPSYAAS